MHNRSSVWKNAISSRCRQNRRLASLVIGLAANQQLSRLQLPFTEVGLI